MKVSTKQSKQSKKNSWAIIAEREPEKVKKIIDLLDYGMSVFEIEDKEIATLSFIKYINEIYKAKKLIKIPKGKKRYAPANMNRLNRELIEEEKILFCSNAQLREMFCKE